MARDVDIGEPTSYRRLVGVSQIFTTTIDLAQAAAAYDLATTTDQNLLIEDVAILLPNIDVTDDATITSIAIATDQETPFEFLTAANGAKANLVAEANFQKTGCGCILKATEKIQLTIAGGAADEATVCTVVIKCRAVISGGYLA